MPGDTSNKPLNVLELVEWFEDVADERAGSRLLTLASTDPASRLSTLRSFYQELAEHRRFSGGWPLSLPAGAIYPTPAADLVSPAPRFAWFGICATDEPAAEAIQLGAQLKALGRLPGAPTWLREGSFGELEAVLGPHLLANPGELTSHAFAFLGEPIGGRNPVMSAAARALDQSMLGGPMLDDGGALQLDAPRSLARALIGAGWLQRLATDIPVVVAVDDAHKAGPFLVELVDTALSTEARILVVLAGEPFASRTIDGPPSRARRRHGLAPTDGLNDGEPRGLAGPFHMHAGEPVAATSLPGGGAGLVTALLGAALPGGLFTLAHVESAAAAVDAGDTTAIVDELVATAWARRIAPAVYAFTSDARRKLAETQARSSLVDTFLTEAIHRVLSEPARSASDNDAFTTLVELGAAAHGSDDHDVVWRFARLLAAYGELDRAAHLATPHATSQLERAVVAAWARACNRTPTHVVDEPTTDDALIAAETLVVRGASSARLDPLLANAMVGRALQLLAPEDADALRPDVRVRLAAARVFLATGDLAGVDRALGEDIRRWLSERAETRLRDLAQWRALPGVLSRTADVLANLSLISALRTAVPASVALAHALLARLALLERLGRLDSADDALAIAFEAARILAPRQQRRPEPRWRAVLWLAWANQRRGDVVTALGLLDELITEQTSLMPEDHPTVLATRQWRARCLLEADRYDEAHTEIDVVLHHRLRSLVDAHPDLVAAHHWHGTILTKLGNHAGAVDELADVVARRKELLAADDEDLLASRLRLGLALAGSGRQAEALRQYNEVIARRAALDIDDAPRLLAARHARAVCLMTMDRQPEALVELDQVLNHRVVALEPDATLVVDVRADRAACLTMLGRHADAIADLDFVIARRQQVTPGDHAAILVSRQQRAVALLAMGQQANALAEVDGVLAAARSWPQDHPMLKSLRAMRDHLVTV